MWQRKLLKYENNPSIYAELLLSRIFGFIFELFKSKVGKLNKLLSFVLYLPIKYLKGSKRGANLKNISLSLDFLGLSKFLTLQLNMLIFSSNFSFTSVR